LPAIKRNLFNEKIQVQDEISTKCLHICGCVKCNTQNGEALNEFKIIFMSQTFETLWNIRCVAHLY